MREWAEQRTIDHKYVGICSDTKAGRDAEDATLAELEIPVTTDPRKISEALRKQNDESMLVVFCTYQSLGLIEEAQKNGAPKFDLTICDEAHRTTGVDLPDKNTSPFTLVHDQKRIRSIRRLYMTATPKIYQQNTKSRAASHNAEVYSMDAAEWYGPEFHRLNFSDAIDAGLLSDYKVVVLGVLEEHADRTLQDYLEKEKGDINLPDAAKIVGCWSAMLDPERYETLEQTTTPIKRAIAFTNTIQSSKNLVKHWSNLVESLDISDEESDTQVLKCRLKHVDGQHHALDRKGRIEWLKGDDGSNTCRILSNARCLSEGIDVPALDAVLFMESKSSKTDIVQAVGRVMRKFQEKRYGYIILPVVVPPGMDPNRVLDDSDKFATVWNVLSALRSHDDRFNIEINQLDLNKNPSKKIIFIPPKTKHEENGKNNKPYMRIPPMLDLPIWNIDHRVFHAKVVEKCGDRRYWESWAKDVADIFARLVVRIEGLLNANCNLSLRERFDSYHEDIKLSINENISQKDAIEMVAQHILTQPVFSALFENYSFASSNPVAKALEKIYSDLNSLGLNAELRDIQGFYDSVRRRAQGLDNAEARQRVLMELYEKFFRIAMKRDAERLGMVYTPVEVVDFMLNSVEWLLNESFGATLTEKDIHVLDPFAGTGIFFTRLLQSNIVARQDLLRKYCQECHANEIVLLAYYIATVHIEQAFHSRCEDEELDESYLSFPGAVLCDTFSLYGTSKSGTIGEFFKDNSARARSQECIPITVVIGNPPWSAGQQKSSDGNPNSSYPPLERRVSETYASRSTATRKASLYDYYKMAIRWASDRIGEKGIVAFVTNGSWIDGNVDSGIRACLAEEFDSIYIVNARGNARTQGKRRKLEGDNIFGQGSRATVAMTFLVRSSIGDNKNCRIFYKDIGDSLSRKEKLQQIGDWRSLSGVNDWLEVSPNCYDDWINQRSEEYQKLVPLGTKRTKAGRDNDAIFGLYSQGLNTSRDAWIYHWSSDGLKKQARELINRYNSTYDMCEVAREEDVLTVAQREYPELNWGTEMASKLKRIGRLVYQSSKVRESIYRPFIKKYCYAEYALVSRKYQLDKLFPCGEVENPTICVPGPGSNKPFSTLMVNKLPNLSILPTVQCFPLYRYVETVQPITEFDVSVHSSKGQINITDNQHQVFMNQLEFVMSKEDIFYYVYGVLHSEEFTEKHSIDMAKSMVRIPISTKFFEFSQAGMELSKLHLNFEHCEEYDLKAVVGAPHEQSPRLLEIGERRMKLTGDKRDTLVVNDAVKLCGIPPEAHEYVVNGRTPIEWIIEQYQYKTDSASGIVSNPNDFFQTPNSIISTIKRAVYVSVESARLIKKLPPIW